MTVEQLIEELQNVKDKNKHVKICTDEECSSHFEVVEDTFEVILD